MRKIVDRELKAKCPKCGKKSNYIPSFTSAPPILKGDGWAKDGYQSKKEE